MAKSFEHDFANPSSPHQLGKDISNKIENSRTLFLNELKTSSKKSQVIFTSSATESNNLFLQGFSWKENDKVLFTQSDHPSLVGPLRHLEKEKKIGLLDISSFLIEENYDELESFIESKKPSFLAIAHVNNTSGQKRDLNLFKKLSEKYDFLLFIDASQSFGKYPIDFESDRFAGISLSAHKMGGPKGIAALVKKRNLSLTPLFFGGGHEDDLRPSTLSAPLIFSWEEALQEIIGEEKKRIEEKKVKEHYLFLKEGLQKIDNRITFPFLKDVSPYILTAIFPICSSDILMRSLEEKHVFISSSSACSSKIKGENPVFKALGIPLHHHKHILRISLSYSTSREECESFLKIFGEILKDLSSFL